MVVRPAVGSVFFKPKTMRKTISEKIKAGETIVSDGAWGTALQNNGLQTGECPELYNLEHKDIVLKIAKLYVEAGSQMVETNTFGGNRFKLENFGLEEQVFEINKAAAEIVREAIGEERNLLGSIGPSGKFIMMEEVTEEELTEAYKEQALALEAGGADAIIIETFTDIDEARCAIIGAKHTKCEIICSMTFDKVVDGYRTMMGVSPAEMLDALLPLGVNVFGANCGNGSAGMLEISKEFRKANKDIPLMIQANAGMPELKDGETHFPETPQEMAINTKELMLAGVNIIGGCCGTTPEHIKHIAQAVNND